MGMELPNGKTARNIQEQVAFITEKVKELFAAVGDLGFKVIKVEELPEEGAARTIYLVPASDPETENAYDEYIWTDEGWEKIGTTDIDLSNYVDLTSNQTIGGNKSFSGVASFIGGANFNGPIKTSFYPETSNSYDLGMSSYVWGFIYVNNLSNASGDLTSHCNLKPSADNALYLGAADIRWKDIYLSGSSNYYYGNSSVVWGIKENQYENLQIQRNGAGLYSFGTSGFFPNSNNARDLGTNSLLFRDLYVSRNITDATNSATVADIAALITYAKAQGWIS